MYIVYVYIACVFICINIHDTDCLPRWKSCRLYDVKNIGVKNYSFGVDASVIYSIFIY